MGACVVEGTERGMLFVTVETTTLALPGEPPDEGLAVIVRVTVMADPAYTLVSVIIMVSLGEMKVSPKADESGRRKPQQHRE